MFDFLRRLMRNQDGGVPSPELTAARAALRSCQEELQRSQEQNAVLEARLRQQSTISSNLVQKNPFSVQIFDLEGHPLEHNDATVRMFGSGPPPGYNLFDDPNLTAQQISESIKSVKDGHLVEFPDVRYNPRDYSPELPDFEIHMHSYVFPALNSAGEPEAIFVIHEDITESVANEAELRRNEAMYRAIFENTGSASILIDSDTGILLANSEWYRLTGYTPEDVANKISWTVFVVKEDLDRMLGYHRARRTEGQNAPNDYEFRLLTKDGRLKHIVLRVGMIPGTGISIASLHDVTDRKTAEEKFRLAFNCAPIPMTIAEAGLGPYVEVNDAAVAFSGFPREELIGQKWTDIGMICETEQQELISGMQQYQKVRDMEVRFTTKDGTIKYTILNADIMEIGGKPHILATVLDITERKAMEQALKDSEEKFRLFAENALDGFVIIRNNRYLYVNQAISNMLGYSSDEVLAFSSITDAAADTALGKPLIASKYAARMKGALRDEPYEAQLLHKDGHTIIDVLLSPVVVNFQNEPNIFLLVQNITARKMVEAQREELMAALLESENKLSSLLRYSSDPVFAFDREGNYLYVNEAFAAPFGRKPEEIIGSNVRDLFGEAEAAQRFRAIREVFDTGQASEIEVFVNTVDDGVHWYMTAIDPIRSQDGHVVSVSCISRDVTRRKMAEDALKISEEKYRSLFLYTPAGVLNYDSSLVITDCNSRFVDILESDRSRLLGVDMNTLKDRSILPALIKSVNGQEGYYEGLYKAMTSNAEKWIYLHTAPQYSADGSLTGGVAIVEDISLRRDAEMERDRLRYLLENVFDSMPSVLIGIDGQRKVTQWNRAACIETGLSESEVLGRDVEEVLPLVRKIRDKVDLALSETSLQHEERISFIEKGEQRYARAVVYPLIGGDITGAVIHMDDITERVRLEEIMIQTEKMMSVGGMAAGMAHEINNPLGGILQGAQNVLRRLDPESAPNRQAAAEAGTTIEAIHTYAARRQIMSFIEGIRNSGIRASNIVSNMLQFSRGSSLKKEHADLAALLENTLELAGSDYDLNKSYDFRHIKIVREYSDSLPEVLCSPVEIEQVVLNLLKNAAQAFVDKSKPPQITMRTRQEGNYAIIEVADNGPGMPEAVRRRVFEPFYTTKPTGAGTGLGLAVSYFIVTNNHRGQIFVNSVPDEGTVFTIYLPFDGRG